MINQSTQKARETSQVLEVYLERQKIAVDKMISCASLNQRAIDAYKELCYRIEMLKKSEALQKMLFIDNNVLNFQDTIKIFYDEYNIVDESVNTYYLYQKPQISEFIEKRVLEWLQQREEKIKINR